MEVLNWTRMIWRRKGSNEEIEKCVIFDWVSGGFTWTMGRGHNVTFTGAIWRPGLCNSVRASIRLGPLSRGLWGRPDYCVISDGQVKLGGPCLCYSGHWSDSVGACDTGPRLWCDHCPATAVLPLLITHAFLQRALACILNPGQHWDW